MSMCFEFDYEYDAELNSKGYFASETLMCYWREIRIVSNNQINIYLAPKHCVHMPEAIKWAKMVLPEVERVNTYAGDIPDTCYVKQGEKWYAILPK